MKRILLGIGMIVFTSAIAAGATGAFFSDTETSTGNTFTAGAIDLKVDSTQHYNNAVCTNGVWVLAAGQTVAVDQYPVLGSACTGSWTLTDLGPTNQFFNFGDVKPGDRGENTVSLHIDNNNAWACLDLRTTGNNENNLIEPEADAGDVTVGAGNGELAQNIKVFAWSDYGATPGFQGVSDVTEGDNIWQANEPMLFSPVALSGIGSTTTLPLADSVTNGGATMAPGVTSYIGLFWCAGNLTAVAGVITCDGSAMGNQSQTDSATTTVSFRVVQSRNNPTFQCGNQIVVQEPITVTVTANDLDAGPRATAATNGLGKWFMYNDTTDVIDNNLGTFVAGPAGVPNGANSIQFVLAAANSRPDIATYKFQGTTLASITQMGFGAYSHNGTGGAGPNESPFFFFDVDFVNSGLYQNRLVYVPSANGAVPQDTWNSTDLLNGGNALWTWSGYVANGNKWPDNNVSQYRTWNAIKVAFPNAKVLGLGGLLGVRVGEPGPAAYIGNVDFFKIATGGPVTTYDFGN